MPWDVGRRRSSFEPSFQRAVRSSAWLYRLAMTVTSPCKHPRDSIAYMWLTPRVSGVNNILCINMRARHVCLQHATSRQPSPLMRYQTSQVIELVGITKETLRHWKKVLQPIFGRDGRGASYSFEEVVALAVIAQARSGLSVPISRFASVAQRLFKDIAEQVDRNDDEVVLCITSGDVGLHSIRALPSDTTLAMVRLQPVVRLVRRTATDQAPELDPQLMLDFSTIELANHEGSSKSKPQSVRSGKQVRSPKSKPRRNANKRRR